MKVKSEEEIVLEVCRGEDFKVVLENGTPEQQYKLAKCLSNEFMHPKIRNLYIKLYKKAADAGHVEASLSLYNQLRYYKKPALKYLKFAAEKGHRGAKLQLAECYIFRNSPWCKKVNTNEEKKGFEIAKELAKKEEYAYFVLAHCYETGRGTEMDLDKAKKCYKILKSNQIERVEMLIRERDKPNKRTREMIVKHHPYYYKIVDDKLVAL